MIIINGACHQKLFYFAVLYGNAHLAHFFKNSEIKLVVWITTLSAFLTPSCDF